MLGAMSVMTGQAVADDTTPSGFTYEPVAGTSVVWRPFVEVEGGYDSNLDGETDGAGSWFERIDTGSSLKVSRDKSTYYFTLRGRHAVFDNLDIRERWEIKASADATYELSETETLNFTTEYHHDFFSFNRANIYTSDADYALRQENYKIRLQAKSTIESNIGGNDSFGDPIDIFNVTRGAAYDYSRTDGYVALLTNTKSWLQPFAIYDYGNLDYFNQVANPIIDRNAIEHFGVAGLRFQPSEKFRIDIGGRINFRDFDDKVTTDFTSSYADVNVFWQPMDTVKITALLERVIKEPSTSFGLADDVRTVGLTFDWTFSKDWLLSATGYYDRVEAIGDDARYNKYLTTLSITYYVNDHLEVFGQALAKWVNEEVSGDAYDRYKTGLGARIKF